MLYRTIVLHCNYGNDGYRDRFVFYVYKIPIYLYILPTNMLYIKYLYFTAVNYKYMYKYIALGI